MEAVRDRLTKEINYWDHRANELRAREEAGKHHSRINSAKARQRADDLETRLRQRLDQLEKERQISPLPPHIIGGCLVVPKSLVERTDGQEVTPPPPTALTRAETERIAMEAVISVERRLGFEPEDVSAEKRGWDVQSRDPKTGSLRFIEVKGRIAGADTVTVTKNEILTALNKPEHFILAIVEIEGARHVHYLWKPFSKEPDFGVTSINYNLGNLLERAENPLNQMG